MPRDKSTRYSYDDLMNTARKLEEHFGPKLPPHQKVKQYLAEHTELASYKTMVLRLGRKSQWLAVLHGDVAPPMPQSGTSQPPAAQPGSAPEPDAPDTPDASPAPPPSPPSAVQPSAAPDLNQGDHGESDNPGQDSSHGQEDENNENPPTPDEASAAATEAQPTSEQISIPIPSVNGKLRLEVELSERSLTLRINFDP